MDWHIRTIPPGHKWYCSLLSCHRGYWRNFSMTQFLCVADSKGTIPPIRVTKGHLNNQWASQKRKLTQSICVREYWHTFSSDIGQSRTFHAKLVSPCIVSPWRRGCLHHISVMQKLLSRFFPVTLDYGKILLSYKGIGASVAQRCLRFYSLSEVLHDKNLYRIFLIINSELLEFISLISDGVFKGLLILWFFIVDYDNCVKSNILQKIELFVNKALFSAYKVNILRSFL